MNHVVVGELLEILHIVAVQSDREHRREHVIDQLTARRAVVIRLLLPIAFPRQSGVVDLCRREAGDRLREMPAVTHAHVAPLVRDVCVAGQAVSCDAERSNELEIGRGHGGSLS